MQEKHGCCYRTHIKSGIWGKPVLSFTTVFLLVLFAHLSVILRSDHKTQCWSSYFTPFFYMTGFIVHYVVAHSSASHTTASRCVITARSEQPDGALRGWESAEALDLWSPAALRVESKSFCSPYLRGVRRGGGGGGWWWVPRIKVWAEPDWKDSPLFLPWICA